MKKFILTLAVLISAAGAFAQNNSMQGKERKTAEERATRASRMMTANLQLSHEQQNKIIPVLIEREKAKDTARAQNENNKEAKKNAVKAANDKADEQLKLILTEEQFKKLLTLREEQKQKVKERKTGNLKDKKTEAAEDEEFY